MASARFSLRTITVTLLLFALGGPVATQEAQSAASVRITVESSDGAEESLLRVVSSSIEVYLNLESLRILRGTEDGTADYAVVATVNQIGDEVAIDLFLHDGASSELLAERSIREPIGPNLDRPIADLAAAVFAGADLLSGNTSSSARSVATASRPASPATSVPQSGSSSDAADLVEPHGERNDGEQRIQEAPAPVDGQHVDPQRTEAVSPTGEDTATEIVAVADPSREEPEAPPSYSVGPASRTPATEPVGREPQPVQGSSGGPERRVVIATKFAPVLPVETAARYTGTSWGGAASITAMPFRTRAVGVGLTVRAIVTTMQGVAARAELLLIPIGLSFQIAGEPAPVAPLVRIAGGTTVLQAQNPSGAVSKLIPYAGVDLAIRAVAFGAFELEVGVGFEAHFEQSIVILGFSPALGVAVSL